MHYHVTTYFASFTHIYKYKSTLHTRIQYTNIHSRSSKQYNVGIFTRHLYFEPIRSVRLVKLVTNIPVSDCFLRVLLICLLYSALRSWVLDTYGAKERAWSCLQPILHSVTYIVIYSAAPTFTDPHTLVVDMNTTTFCRVTTCDVPRPRERLYDFPSVRNTCNDHWNHSLVFFLPQTTLEHTVRRMIFILTTPAMRKEYCNDDDHDDITIKWGFRVCITRCVMMCVWLSDSIGVRDVCVCV